jgi:hypothetical protein
MPLIAEPSEPTAIAKFRASAMSLKQSVFRCDKSIESVRGEATLNVRIIQQPKSSFTNEATCRLS